MSGWWAPLLGQLRWFIRLRWLAGCAVLAGALLDRYGKEWFTVHDAGIAIVGAMILSYNAALWWVLRTPPPKASRRAFLLWLAWIQFVLDVIALTFLTVWTGGPSSPLLGLFVLHMVFAGLLLPQVMAFAAAGVTMAILLLGFQMAEQWPILRATKLMTLGWCGAQIGTVLVASHIARSLRLQRRRLLRQNRRILSMARRLRRQERRMLQSEKMFALGQMAAGVAHEIANPLASMDSLLQLMIRRPDKPRPDAIQTLRDQIERISRIVRELTTFSRPTDAEWRTLSLNDVVRDSLNMLSFDKRMRQVSIVEDLSADPAAVTIPLLSQNVQQVLINLIRNALDATEETPGATVRIRTLRENDWCMIEVSDNGPGIEPRNLRRLFEPFFTTKPVGRGTGLGLSISYSLIQKHGGLISARSKPGEGASFTIKLPAERKAAAVEA